MQVGLITSPGHPIYMHMEPPLFGQSTQLLGAPLFFWEVHPEKWEVLPFSGRSAWLIEQTDQFLSGVFKILSDMPRSQKFLSGASNSIQNFEQKAHFGQSGKNILPC